MSEKLGKIIIIVAPSGTGKSTLIKNLKEKFPKLEESVSYTTRPKREGDEHGLQYFFINTEEFKSRIDKNEFIEWAIVHDNFYGTSKKFVESKLNEGTSLLFDLDVQGADSFKEYFQEKANAIFIAPPSIDDLRKRLEKRATDSQEVINRRLKNAEKEILKKNEYDYLVVNDDFDHALSKLEQIFEKVLN